MHRKYLLLSSALATFAFANAPAAATDKPAAKKAGAPKADERVAASFTGVRTDIPMPAAKRSNSEFDKKIAELEVGASFGLTNKTKEQMSSRLSKVHNHKDNQRPAVNADGTPKTVAGKPIVDPATGAVTGVEQTPVFEKVKEFVMHNVDPKTDPDGATVRIWRNK